MNIFKENRLIFQQQAKPNPEQQTQPPPVEKTQEAPPQSPETQKEALPSSGEDVSNGYKEKAKQTVTSANAKLDIFQNLTVG